MIFIFAIIHVLTITFGFLDYLLPLMGSEKIKNSMWFFKIACFWYYLVHSDFVFFYILIFHFYASNRPDIFHSRGLGRVTVKISLLANILFFWIW